MRLSQAPPFLSADQVAAELARFTYRPGWELSGFVDRWEGVCFRVVATVPNSYQPDGEPVQLRINSRMPPFDNVDQLRHWVLWRIIQIEMHEAREWLKIDGRMLSDPHDPVEPDPT